MMVSLQRPPTHLRYLAEINNVIGLRVRPVCIQGQPRATVDEIRAFLGAQQLSYHELYVRGSLIVVWDDCIIIKKFN
jgi:hypothetical protein